MAREPSLECHLGSLPTELVGLILSKLSVQDVFFSWRATSTLWLAQAHSALAATARRNGIELQACEDEVSTLKEKVERLRQLVMQCSALDAYFDSISPVCSTTAYSPSLRPGVREEAVIDALFNTVAKLARKTMERSLQMRTALGPGHDLSRIVRQRDHFVAAAEGALYLAKLLGHASDRGFLAHGPALRDLLTTERPTLDTCLATIWGDLCNLWADQMLLLQRRAASAEHLQHAERAAQTAIRERDAARAECAQLTRRLCDVER